MMLPKSWFIAVDDSASLEESRGAVGRFLAGLRRSCHTSLLRRFDMAGNRRVTLLSADETGVVENASYWLLSFGPRPFDAVLRQALIVADSINELRQLCSSLIGQDNALLVIDKNAGDMHVITGPLNVTKIFCSELDGRRLLASSISLFPRECLTLNMGAVASYVLNGCCLNGHTIFQEIDLLDRASCHEFSAEKHGVSPYWDFVPGQAVNHTRSQSATAGALWELMVQSVARLTAGKRVLLALSGGYDSGVMLGILGGYLKHPEVKCFSYVLGSPRAGSDAEVASRRAAFYGYEHVAINSYSGDLVQMLDSNAAIGQALRCPSYEIEAYPALFERYGNSNSVMLFGDECLGRGSFSLKGADDILGATVLRAPALLDECLSVAGVEPAARLRNGLETEYSKLRRLTQKFADPDDAKDFLYLDQRMQFHLLPLRTFIAGHWFSVAMPLISTEIIDFMATVPVADRLDKRLFKQIARQFLPDIFRIRPAIRGQLHPDFDREIIAARTNLEGVIASRNWRIEGLVSSDALRQMLSTLQVKVAKRAASSGRRDGLKRVLKKRAKALLASSRFLEDRQHWFRRLAFNEFAVDPGLEFQLLNLLSLADFLADREFFVR